MAEYINCGIDAHDKTLVCRTAADKGEPETAKFRNTMEGQLAMLRWLQTLKKDHGAKRIVIAYEASSLGFGLYDSLTAAGTTCHVLAPHKIRQSADDRKKKTDIRDAQRILEQLKNHYLAGNELPAVWIPDPELREDRQLVRARLEAGNKVTEVKTQIRTFLKANGIVVKQTTKKPWTKPYRFQLQRLATRDGGLGESLQCVLGSLLRVLRTCEEECVQLEEAIDKLSKTARYDAPCRELVRKIKGVATLSAMVFLTEMGDMNRFRNRRQVGSYIGLVPTSFETGQSDDRKGRITRQGPQRVRKILCQSVWCATRYNARESVIYHRIVAKNPKRKKVAVVACMRRLAIRMWHVARIAQQSTPRTVGALA